MFNPREQQFSNPMAPHARMHSHATDVYCRAFGVGRHCSHNYMRVNGYPEFPVFYPFFYLMLPGRSDIECFGCISPLILAKGFAK
jgi:hypothetical protein